MECLDSSICPASSSHRLLGSWPITVEYSSVDIRGSTIEEGPNKLVSYFTKRNHYNPCFWTAIWNTEFFQAFLNGEEPAQAAREHEVFALTIRGDRIFRTKVKNVHYDKDLGVAEITPDGIRQFCQRWYPEKYDAISRDIDEHPESVFIDFEDILSAVERMDGYSSLLQAAKISGLSSDIHQGFLTCNLIMHAMRSHEIRTFASRTADRLNGRAA